MLKLKLKVVYKISDQSQILTEEKYKEKIQEIDKKIVKEKEFRFIKNMQNHS